MSESVGCHKVIFRLACGVLVHYCIHLLVVRVREEYRFDVGILDADVDHSVIFLVLAGKLMLLDLAFSIIVSVGTYDKSVLCASIHCLCVYVIARLSVLDKPSLFLP